jgi:hypothetical protein
MKKISFIVADDTAAEMFIADAKTTPDVIAYLDENGDDHELQISDLQIHDVHG